MRVLNQMFKQAPQPYTWTDALRWCCEICEALRHLHTFRPMVVHRDLKLENVSAATCQGLRSEMEHCWGRPWGGDGECQLEIVSTAA